MSKRKPKSAPKRGRPPLPKGEALEAVLPLRCRQDELDAFRSAAARDGLSLSAWIRQALKRAV